MKLYFENSYGEKRIIGNPNSEQEAFKIINNFLKKHNFKSYYTRTWNVNNFLCIDVGSHSEFFYLEN